MPCRYLHLFLNWLSSALIADANISNILGRFVVGGAHSSLNFPRVCDCFHLFFIAHTYICSIALFLYSITSCYFPAVFAGDEDTFTILECLRIPAVYDPYTIGELKSKVFLFELHFQAEPTP
jgi:hypothetical protein